MNYERNKLYFSPTPEMVPILKKVGCAPIISLIIGVLLLWWVAKIGGGHEWVGYLIGLALIGVGIGLILRVKGFNARNTRMVADFNENRTIVQGSEIDSVCQDFLHANLKSMALKKLGVDEDQCGELEPIVCNGYCYRGDLKGSAPEIREGDDRVVRSSHHSGTIFFFSADQIYCYQHRFSLLEDVKQETTKEFFYRDIVDASTTTDTISFGKGDGVGGKITFEEFVLTTTGGTIMSASISDDGTIERSIQKMKGLLRNKKK